jgi:hypothetical protein
MPKIAWVILVVTLLLGCHGLVDDGGGGSGGPPSSGGAIDTGLPCDVQAVLAARCTSCHGVQPLAGVPMALVTYGDLTKHSTVNAAQTYAERAVLRMQDAATPMPPAPATAAPAGDVAALSAWIAAGYPQGSCADGGAAPDPFAVPPTCTSNTRWTLGTEGSPSMSPGQACIACHTSSGGEAPRFALAGTVYPTAHEPNDCNGASGTGGAQVVITGADGRAVTLTPNGAGNFYYQGTVALPYLAKVLYMGRERVMVDKQTSGDCNACHTQSGTMNAPGRIILP